MNRIFYFIMLLLGSFFIFWATIFYYYNPTFIDPTFKYAGYTNIPLKIAISLIFFWGLFVVGLGLVLLGIYKLFFKK